MPLHYLTPPQLQLQDMHATNVPTTHCVQYTLPHPNFENILKAFFTSAVVTQQVAILHSSTAVKGALATVTGCTYDRGHLKGMHGGELKSVPSCETLGLPHAMEYPKRCNITFTNKQYLQFS